MKGRLTEALTQAIRASRPSVEGTDEHLANEDLDALADRVADALGCRGARPGEPVHVLIANQPSDLAALLGIWRAHAVAVPVHATAPPPVLDRLQTTTKARFMVYRGKVRDIGAVPPPDRPLLRGAALVVFTSGSTGQPKGVVLGHDRLMGKLEVLLRLLAPRASDVVLVPLQLTFIFGIWVSLLTIIAGGRLRLMPRFSADAVWRALEGDVSLLAVVPTMLRALTGRAAGPAPGLRMLLTGGEPLGEPLARSVRATLPASALYDLYGLTETGSCDLCLAPEDQPAGFGAIGRTTEDVAFRLAEDGSVLPEGGLGELQIRTPFAMLGYLDDPGLTDASFSDGFFKTGDLARLREDGTVELIGRANDMIVRGGNKIAPLELDHIFARHPAVQAALCAGVPDSRRGEAIHLVVVPREGATLDAHELREWAMTRLERYKVPDLIEVRDALPLSQTGKADRAAIVRSALDQRSRES